MEKVNERKVEIWEELLEREWFLRELRKASPEKRREVLKLLFFGEHHEN